MTSATLAKRIQMEGIRCSKQSCNMWCIPAKMCIWNVISLKKAMPCAENANCRMNPEWLALSPCIIPHVALLSQKQAKWCKTWMMLTVTSNGLAGHTLCKMIHPANWLTYYLNQCCLTILNLAFLSSLSEMTHQHQQKTVSMHPQQLNVASFQSGLEQKNQMTKAKNEFWQKTAVHTKNASTSIPIQHTKNAAAANMNYDTIYSHWPFCFCPS